MKQILLVDDERIVLESISKTVNWHACGVTLAGVCKNAFEALEAIKNQHPDIVITDIKMPVMDGLELIHKVREFDTHVEFIILSGYGEFELAKQAMKEGVRHFLLKPCSEEEIREAVAGALKELSMRSRRIESRTEMDELLEDQARDFTDVILDYVQAHFADEDLNLKWIAKELVFLNEDYVSKCFLRRTGSRFTSYLNQTRVEEARRLLESSVGCEAVARIVGYGNNPKYFAKVFKKYTGYTPKEYKDSLSK